MRLPAYKASSRLQASHQLELRLLPTHSSNTRQDPGKSLVYIRHQDERSLTCRFVLEASSLENSLGPDAVQETLKEARESSDYQSLHPQAAVNTAVKSISLNPAGKAWAPKRASNRPNDPTGTRPSQLSKEYPATFRHGRRTFEDIMRETCPWCYPWHGPKLFRVMPEERRVRKDIITQRG